MPEPTGGDRVVVCANHRLARSLRAAHDRAQAAAGRPSWQPLTALTPGQWLAGLIGEALLDGTLPPAQAPRLALSAAQERLLWRQAIDAALAAAADPLADALFDRDGLAAAAAEANALCEVWNLRPDVEAGEETRQFLAWRRHFRHQCHQYGWLEPPRLTAWQIRCIAEGAGRLPARVDFAGFDRQTPQEMALRQALASRGVAVGELALGRAEAGDAAIVACADRRAECRAVAAWAAARLAAEPQARLGIVVPELGSVRSLLLAALDDALHPEALLADHAEAHRCYNVSLGEPLARVPLVAVALDLLQLLAQPRRCEQTALGALLCGPYWSAWQGEADDRARLDAAMRRHLPPEFGLARWLAFVKRFERRALALPVTRGAIEALAAAAEAGGGRRLPSAWGEFLTETLAAAGWPGERPLSSREWQAREAFAETLSLLAGFDAMLGKVALAEAVRQLARLCRERVFQPETIGTPGVEVMGPLEAAGLEFDALWVLGMNDAVWPPPPRPNPLLPAALQRRARSANASAEVQLEFARNVQRRLLHAAPDVTFSWAQAEGDRQLRPSPLIADLPERAAPAPLEAVAAAQVGRGDIERLDDHIAPPVAAGEKVAGGTGLLRAQALCPAWAFYRYRLGARPLETPLDGLDARGRGTLLHLAMEHFFAGRTQDELAALDAQQRDDAIQAAVAAAFARFEAGREEALPARFARMERGRLAALLGQWLALELERPVPFAVVASEREQRIEFEGIDLVLQVDRIDELADGRRLIVDYKTGDPKTADWQGERIAEPQLPLYATKAGQDNDTESRSDEHASPPREGRSGGAGHICGVMFARVRADECAFVGWAEDKDLVPGVKAVDWPVALAEWQAALATVAREIRDGYAAVSFARESDLQYCDVLPLLRLPEVRKLREDA